MTRHLHMPAIAVMLLIVGVAGAGERPKPIWLVVTRPVFIEALAPLAEHRRKEGMEVVVSTEPVNEALAGASRRPACLLLVGDDEADSQTQPWYLPARRKRLYRWQEDQPTHFASDSAWGDLDGDGVADVPVGRIPARTPEHVRRVVRKIIAYERRQPTVDDLRLLVWAGTPNYGASIDRMATRMALAALQRHAPAWATPCITTGDARHPLCGWPPDQPQQFLKQLARGSALTVLMGHGTPTTFYSMTHDGRQVLFTARMARRALAHGPPAAPIVLFTCDGGRFTGTEPCFTESMLLAPGGPVAAIGATTASHPLPNYFDGVCLLQQLGRPVGRLGTLWLRTQRQAASARDFLVERMLANAEGSLEEKIDVGKLRRDNTLMYALLGDPATRLRLPRPMRVTVDKTESGWAWRAVRPTGVTDVHAGLRALRPSFPPVPADTGAQSARDLFHAANDAFIFAPLPARSVGGAWSGTASKAGLLRIVGIGPNGLYAAIARLTRPTGALQASDAVDGVPASKN